MTSSRKYAAVLLAALAGVAAAAFSLRAQPQDQPSNSPLAANSTVNSNVVLLDPAHGGTETGATLADNVVEKDVTLVLAGRLQAALTQAGFTVLSTRPADAPDPITTDQRAEIANRAHAVACIVLHATATGSGVHVYASTLQPLADAEDANSSGAFIPTPWDSAQSAFVSQSLSLQSTLSSELGKSHLPALIGKAPLRPLNNLMCPAVAIELAPLLAPGVGATPVTDATYQQQVANTLANALKLWRDRPDSSATSNSTSDDAASARAIAAAEAAGRAAALARAAAAAAAAPAPARGTQ